VKALALLLILVTGFWPGKASAADAPLTVYYEERPPYQLLRTDGGVEGLTADPAAQAFKAAGIGFVWQESSMSRQMHVMRENQGQACVVGWFKNSERLAFAKFTKPIYRDRAIVALVRNEFGAIAGRSLDEALATPGLRVLVRGKYTYGAVIDSALKRVQPLTIASPNRHLQLVEQLVKNRADLMFAAEEEAEELLSRSGGAASGLQIARFAEPVPGEHRHIVCTFKVEDATITRLNKAIDGK
jgi:polar amino acid transport system substrate-binding protein